MANIRQLLRMALDEGETFKISNAEQLARVMLAESRTDADKTRREFAERIIAAYYADNLLDFEQFLKRFAFDKPENKAHVKSALVRQYAYTKATVFNAGLNAVEVHVGDEIDLEQTKLLRDIMERGRWFEAMQQAARLEKIVNTVHLVQRASEGTVWLDTVTPDESIVFQKPTSPNAAAALMYRLTDLELFDSPNEASVSPQLWAFWSDEENFMFVTDATATALSSVEAPANNPQRVNPFGQIPAVKIQNERPPNGEYWGPVAIDIWLAEMSISASFMAVVEAIINQGFTLTYSSGFKASLFNDGRGTGTHFNVEKVRQGEESPTFGSVKLDANIAQMVNGADSIAQHIALMRGLPPQTFSIKQAAESGFSKLVDLAPALEEREGDVVRWTGYMRELFDLLKKTWPVFQNQEGFEAAHEGSFSDDAEIFISFAMPAAFETPIAKLERIEKAISLGLMSEVEALIELDPDLDEKKAEAKLEQIRLVNGATRGSAIEQFAVPPAAADPEPPDGPAAIASALGALEAEAEEVDDDDDEDDDDD